MVNQYLYGQSIFIYFDHILWPINLYLFCLQRIHNTFQYSVYEIQSWLIAALHNYCNLLDYTTILSNVYIQCALIYRKSDISSINNKCHPIYIQCALIYSNSNIYSTNGLFFCDLSNAVQIEMDILFIAKCIPEIEMLLLFMCRLYSVVSTRTDLSVHESVTLSVKLSTNCISENIKNSSSNDKSCTKQLMKLQTYSHILLALIVISSYMFIVTPVWSFTSLIFGRNDAYIYYLSCLIIWSKKINLKRIPIIYSMSSGIQMSSLNIGSFIHIHKCTLLLRI